MQLQQITFQRRITPLSLTQFLGVYTNNAYKMLVLLAVFGTSGSFFKDSLFLLCVAFTTILPFYLFAGPAGRISDRIAKRSVILISNLLEVLILGLGILAFAKQGQWGILPFFAVIFLLSTQNAFFSPAIYGIVPETFRERELSRANGDMGAATFFAIIAGLACGPAIKYLTGNDFVIGGTFLCAVSLIGLLIATKLVHVPYERLKRSQTSHKFMESLRFGYREVTARRGMLLAVLGNAFFLGVGIAIQILLILFAKYSLKDCSTQLEWGILQCAPAFGMAVGCFLAGHLSRSKIELGLLPFAAAGVAVSLPLAAYFPGATTILTLTTPSFITPVISATLHLHLSAMFWLFAAGVCGGIFVVPMRAYFQQRTTPTVRGSAFAFYNMIGYTAILITSLLIFVFALGTAKNDPDVPALFASISSTMPYLTPELLLTMLGVATFIVTIYTMWLLPDFAFRFFVITLTHTVYRIKAFGQDNIPERGPALLLANHVSFIDGILISACTSRTIRFLMHEDYYKHPLINPIARLTGYIEVPSTGKAKSMRLMFGEVQDALRRGHLICVFPEGRLTRNGVMNEFKSGYEKMIPEGMDIPIIPVRIGLIWGSIFTYFYGKLKLRLPHAVPHYTTVTFGEPMPTDSDAFQIRQKIQEIGAETEMDPVPQERPLHYLLARLAKRHPFRPLFSDHGGASYSAMQMLIRSILVSWEIRRMVEPNCKYVGVLLPNSTAAATCILGTLYSDKVPAPLNFTASAATLKLSIEKAKITHVLTSRKFIEKIKLGPMPEMVFLEDLIPAIPLWKKLLVAAGAVLLPHQELMNLVSPLTHRDVGGTAALLFSSGSTGIPKGVMLTHHNMNSDIRAVIDVTNWNGKDIVLGNLPLFHSFGLNTCFWLPLQVGGRVVFVPSPLDSAMVGEALQQNRITILLATPTFLQAYLRKCSPERFDSVRMTIVGAEKLRSDIFTRFSTLMNNKRMLIEGYGCTELSPIVSININERLTETGQKCGKEMSIGPALPGVCTKIADPMSYMPLPPDTEGLLMVKGPIVMEGYLGEPELTKDAIHDGWYNTGDIAKMDEKGYITICGRLSRFSKIGGEMVPHELVECAINEICGLDQRVATVTGIPDKVKGEALLVLYTKDMPMTPEEVMAAMRAKHISNLWIPKAQNFILTEHLPLLGSGKLDLQNLRLTAEKISAERNGLL